MLSRLRRVFVNPVNACKSDEKQVLRVYVHPVSLCFCPGYFSVSAISRDYASRVVVLFIVADDKSPAVWVLLCDLTVPVVDVG